MTKHIEHINIGCKCHIGKDVIDQPEQKEEKGEEMIKVLVVTNEYADCPKIYYIWSDPMFYMESVLDEVKQNIEAGYSINLEVIEMSEKDYDKLPIIN